LSNYNYSASTSVRRGAVRVTLISAAKSTAQ